jgi:hypothetical protein
VPVETRTKVVGEAVVVTQMREALTLAAEERADSPACRFNRD